MKETFFYYGTPYGKRLSFREDDKKPIERTEKTLKHDRLEEWKGGERSVHFDKLIRSALSDLEYDDGVRSISTKGSKTLIVTIGPMRDTGLYERKVAAALRPTPYGVDGASWKEEDRGHVGTFVLSKKRFSESITGFSDDDVREYTQRYIDEHPDLPKLVAYKVIANELNADYETDLTPGDVKLVLEGQAVPTDDPFVAVPTDEPYDGVMVDDYELLEAKKTLRRAGYRVVRG